MKQKLITALTTKFTGVDAKILNRIADNLSSSKTIESDEDVNSVVEEVTFADVLQSYGDSRATEASKSAVSNYEKKHHIKDGKPVEQKKEPQESDNNDDDSDAPAKTDLSPLEKKFTTMLKALSDKLDASQKEITALRQSRVSENRRKALDDAIKDLKASQKKAYARIPVDSYTDDDFTQFIEDVKGEVADMVKENRAADAASFSTPFGMSHNTGDNETKATDAEIAEIVSKLN